MQESVIEQLAQLSLKERIEVCQVNNPIAFDHSETIESNKKIIQDRYNLKSYGQKLDALYQGIISSNQSKLEFGSPRTLLHQFLDPKRFNLLRT